MKKTVIIHYQAIENYPPAMNFINEIAIYKNLKSFVITNDIGKPLFVKEGVDIKRITKLKSNYLRYINYLEFNIFSLIELIKIKPNQIVVYETHSVLPVYFYKLINKKTLIFIHYHEYVSKQEYIAGSFYLKLLQKFEKKLLKKCDFVSHTNSDRVNLFKKDNDYVVNLKTIITPNYPPSFWYQYSQTNKAANSSSTIRMVHVGALSLETMYLNEICNWVIKQNGKFSLHFYTDNITESAKFFLDNLSSSSIKLFQSINYYDLPKILIKYDIGITIYKGHILNYVFNVPNKILEYLACGLWVWYSESLVSTTTFVNQNSINGCEAINFSKIINVEQKFKDYQRFNMNDYYAGIIQQQNNLLQKLI